MGANKAIIPPPPPGFTLDQTIPPPPPGFVLDEPTNERSLAGFGANVVESGGRFLGDIGTAIMNPLDTAKAVGGLALGGFQKLIPGEQGAEKNVDALVNLYVDRYGGLENLKKTAYEDPVGMLADFATLAGGGAMLAKGAGMAAKGANLAKTAEMVGKVGRVAGAIGEVADPLRMAGKGVALAAKPLKPAAARLYESALKPSLAAKNVPKVAEQIKTGLREGIPVSQAGVEKIGNLIDDLQGKITDEIAARGQAGAKVSPMRIAARADETSAKFAKQVNPEADLQAISGAKKEFLNRHAIRDPDGNILGYRMIPVAEAQAVKVGTYQQLRKKYGELSGASIEAQKALARGIKEELVAAIPELAELNARESKLINLDSQLQKAVARIRNHQIFGIGTPIVAAGVGAVTESTKAALVAGAIRAMIDHPGLKSRLAIVINSAGKRNPTKYGHPTMATAISRVQEYIDALDASQAGSAGAPPTP